MLLLTRLRFPYLAILYALLTIAAAQAATTVVSVTSTKTVHVTATDYAGACDHFVGACVVYGTNGAAPYTTTVYVSRPSPPSSFTTSTTTVIATTTASNSGACAHFVGACVVYATNAASSTVYYPSAGASSRPGNAQGYIGPKQPDSDGYIGRSVATRRTWRRDVFLGLVGLAMLSVMWL